MASRGADGDDRVRQGPLRADVRRGLGLPNPDRRRGGDRRLLMTAFSGPDRRQRERRRLAEQAFLWSRRG